MKDSVQRFRFRRAERMGIKSEKDPVARYRERRFNRILARLDADENENGGGNHGNTRIPFGLCEREGIKIEKGWTPEDAWNALKGKGYKPEEVYSELQKTGKVPQKSAIKSEKPKMDMKQAESAIKSYRKQENKIAKMGRDVEGKLWREVYESRWEADLLKRKGKTIQEKIDESKRRYPSLDDLDAETRKQVTEARKNLEQELWETVDKSKEVEAKCEEAKRKRDEVKEQRVKEIEKLESQKEEYQDAIMVKYPAYSDCNNKKEFLERFDANRYFSDGHSSNFGRLDYKDAITIAEDIDSFFEMNPKMRGKLGYLEVKSMYYSGLSWPDHVELDSKDFDGRSKWLTRRSAFHGRDAIDTQKQTIFHEYTHQIDEYMSRKLGLKTDGFSKYVYEETVKRLKESKSPLVDGLEAQIPERIKGEKREEFLKGLINEKVKRSVSMYAYKGGRGVHKDDVEFFAEAYSIFQLSKEPGEVEKIVGQIVKEAFDKLED